MLLALTVAHHAISSGELWFGILGLLIGLLIGVHMSQPRYFRRD